MSSTESVSEILNQMITALNADPLVSTAFSEIRIISPRMIPPLMASQLPFIGIAPVRTEEEWMSSHKRESINTVEVYVANEYLLDKGDMESAIAKIKMVMDCLRGSTLTNNYLSKPIQIVDVDYDTIEYGDSDNREFLIVGTVTLDCRRLFIGT